MRPIHYLSIGIAIGAGISTLFFASRLQKAKAENISFYQNVFGGDKEEVSEFRGKLLDWISPDEAIKYAKEQRESQYVRNLEDKEFIQAVLHCGYLSTLENGNINDLRKFLVDRLSAFYIKFQGINASDGPTSEAISTTLKQIDKLRKKSTMLDEKIKSEQGDSPNPLQPPASGDR